MAVDIINELYGGNGLGSASLNANAGDWVPIELDFLYSINHNANVMNEQVTFHDVGGVTWLELESSATTWDDKGFTDGKVLQITAGAGTESSGLFPLLGVYAAIVHYTDVNKLFITSVVNISGNATLADGVHYPDLSSAGGEVNALKVESFELPETIQWDFNLTKENVPALASLIDGSVSRFIAHGINNNTLLTEYPMTQVNDKSGGLFTGVKVMQIADQIDGYTHFRIKGNLFISPIIEAGETVLSWFDGVGTVAGIHRLKVFPQTGNPSTAQDKVSTHIQGNVGGFNENFNTGLTDFSVDSIVFTDTAGSVVNSIGFNGTTHFEAIVNGNAMDYTHSYFNLGMVWRSNDVDRYSNNVYSLGENLAVLAPNAGIANTKFRHSTSLVAQTQENGFTTPEGAKWSFNNLQFEMQSGNLIHISGDIIAGVNNEALFSSLDDDAILHTLWFSARRDDIDIKNQNRTSLILWEGSVIDIPVFGVEFKTVGDRYLDHSGAEITTGIVRDITTEDDVSNELTFRLSDTIQYDGVRATIEAYNPTTTESFTLEETYISFGAFPYVNNIHEVYTTIPRAFNLPPASDKDQIDLNRLPLIDTTLAFTGENLYGMRLNYGFLSRWENWLEQLNANLHFFDVTEENNGLNKDWQRISADTDWVIRRGTYLAHDGLEDYHHSIFNIRPYEDEDADTVITMVDTFDNSVVTSLIANTIMEITAVVTWNTFNFDINTEWAQATIEDYQGANRWVISDVLPQGNISQNPLKPIAGETGLQVVIVGNTATFKYLVDTSLLTTTDVCFTHRIHSDRGTPEENGKRMEDGTLKATEDNIIKQLD